MIEKEEKAYITGKLSGGGGGDLTNYYTKSETDSLLNDKQNVLTAGDNIEITSENIINSLECRLHEDFTVTNPVGLLQYGQVLPQGTLLVDIIKDMLTISTPTEEYTFYYGTSSVVPTSVDGFDSVVERGTVLDVGFVTYFTTDGKQYECIAFEQKLGTLSHIYENDLESFDLISQFTKADIEVNSVPYYLYYGTDLVKETNAKYRFLWS